MENVLIRPATIEDAEMILRIYEHYILNTAVTFEYDTPTIEEFRTKIKQTLKKYPYLVAEKDGKILGYAYAGEFKEREAYKFSVELSIYVDKDYKKRGLGRILYEKLEEELSNNGIKNLYACIATPCEEDKYLTFDSVYFHEHLGFKKVGELHKCGYKFKHWYNLFILEKCLN